MGIAGRDRPRAGVQTDLGYGMVAQTRRSATHVGADRSEYRYICLDKIALQRKVDVMTMTALQRTPHPSIWWLILLQGIAGILLGLMLITAPGETMLALVTFLGFYWLITGVLSLVQMFVDPLIPWFWSLISGILGIVAGILVLKHPMLAALTVPTLIVIVLGVEALIMGGVNLIAGFKGGGVASVILGVVNILIGLLLLSSPASAALAVPLVFGVILLVQGVFLAILAFRVKP
jgi:uncharacterized membrane protein HdeD (DUF308 family)